jgi:hypothetical protein
MTNLLHRYDKFVKISRSMFENPTVNFNALFNTGAKTACCSSELTFTFLYEGNSMKKVSQQFVSCIELSFVNFVLLSTQKAKI